MAMTDDSESDEEILSIEDIPTDLLIIIIKLLSVEDVSILMMVNKYFNKLCLEESVIRIVGLKDMEWLQSIPKKMYMSTQKLSCTLWRNDEMEVIKDLFESINSLKHLKVLGNARFEPLLQLNAINLVSIEIYNAGKPYFFGNFLLTKTNINQLKKFKIYGTLHIDQDFIEFISKSKLEELSFEEIVFPINKCGQMDKDYIENAFISLSKTLKSTKMGFHISDLNDDELKHTVFKTLLLSPTICNISVDLMQYDGIIEFEQYIYYFSAIRATHCSLHIDPSNNKTMQKILSILPPLHELTLISNHMDYLRTKNHFEDMINFILESNINISNQLNIQIVSHRNNNALEILADVLEKKEKKDIAFKMVPKLSITNISGETCCWTDILFIIAKIKDNLVKMANEMLITWNVSQTEKIKNNKQWMNIVSLVQRTQICELQKDIEYDGEPWENLKHIYKVQVSS